MKRNDTMKQKYLLIIVFVLLVAGVTVEVLWKKHQKALEVARIQAEKIATEKRAEEIKAAKAKECKAVLDEYLNATKRIDDIGNQKIIKADTDNMPQEWRHRFITAQLFLYQLNGGWNEMLAIRDRLMNKKRVNKTDSLLDADILLEIKGYFCNVACYPPNEIRKVEPNSEEYRKFACEYWETHYKDEKEVERILQYVVDNFDNNYAPVADAYFSLACSQKRLGKNDLALKNYQAFDAFDRTKLYCIPMLDSSGKMLPVEEVFKDQTRNFDIAKTMVRPYIVELVSQKPAAD